MKVPNYPLELKSDLHKLAKRVAAILEQLKGIEQWEIGLVLYMVASFTGSTGKEPIEGMLNAIKKVEEYSEEHVDAN